MVKSIGILDKDYTLWVKELVKRIVAAKSRRL